MPVLNAKRQSVDVGLQCDGCRQAFEDHNSSWFCQYSLPNGANKILNDVSNMEVLTDPTTWTCRAAMAVERLYSQEDILEHLDVCKDAQVLVEGTIKFIKDAIGRSELKEVFTKFQENNGNDFWTTYNRLAHSWEGGELSVTQTGRFLRGSRVYRRLRCTSKQQ